MIKKIIPVLVLTVMLSGCATFRRDQSMVTQLQMRVGDLERSIQAKDQRITELEYDVKDLTYTVDQLKERAQAPRTLRRVSSSSSKSTASSSKGDDRIIRVDVEYATVQQALKNAGYYSGNIDGKIGPATKKSIYQFQKDYSLKADGLVGQETWGELKKFIQ